MIYMIPTACSAIIGHVGCKAYTYSIAAWKNDFLWLTLSIAFFIKRIDHIMFLSKNPAKLKFFTDGCELILIESLQRSLAHVFLHLQNRCFKRLKGLDPNLKMKTEISLNFKLQKVCISYNVLTSSNIYYLIFQATS